MDTPHKEDTARVEGKLERWFVRLFKREECIRGHDQHLLCQIDEHRFLIKRSIRPYSLHSELVVYDIDKNRWSPFKSLKLFENSGNTDIRALRYDPCLEIYIGLDGYYNSSRLIFQLPGFEFSIGFTKSISEDVSGFSVVQVKIDAFFVIGNRIFLLEHLNLISLSKDRIIERILYVLDSEPGRRGDDLSIEDHELDPVVCRLNPTLGKSLIMTWVTKDRLYFIFGEEMTLFPRICSIVTYDPVTTQVTEQRLPYLDHCDGRLWVELYENKGDTFLRYLFILSLVQHYLPDSSSLPFFITRGRICYPANVSYTFDIDKITDKEIKEFSSLIDFNPAFLHLYSRDDEAVRSGILDYLRMSGPANDVDLQYIYHEHQDLILNLLEEELDRCPFEANFLDNTVNLLKRFPNRVELARKLLKGNASRQYIGLLLARGRLQKTGIESKLAEDSLTERAGPYIDEIFASEDDIPCDAVKCLVDKALEEYEKMTQSPLASQKANQDRIVEILRNAVRTAGSWETSDGLEIIRGLAGQIDEVEEEIAEVIGDLRIYELQDLLLALLDHPNTKILEKAIKAVGILGIIESEDRIIPFLGHVDDLIRIAAIDALARIGSRASLVPLFYSAILTMFLEGATSPTSEEDGIGAIVQRELDRPIGNRLEGRASSEDDEVIENYAHCILIYLLLHMVREDRDLLALDDENYKGEVLLCIVQNHYAEHDLASHFNLQTIKDYFDRRKRGRVVHGFLECLANSEIENDTCYLAALLISFCPGTIDFSKESRRVNNIVYHLNRILERMQSEDDFRGILSAMALLKVGVKEWEKTVLDLFEKNEWLGWPRLVRVGQKVLQYRPPTDMVPVYLCLLKNQVNRLERRMLIEKLESIDTRATVRAYEEGMFPLDPFAEALLYGKIGDDRGYRYVLEHTTELRSVEGLEYLGKFGGEEAIDVLERAMQEDGPKEVIIKALGKIRKRIEKNK